MPAMFNHGFLPPHLSDTIHTRLGEIPENPQRCQLWPGAVNSGGKPVMSIRPDWHPVSLLQRSPPCSRVAKKLRITGKRRIIEVSRLLHYDNTGKAFPPNTKVTTACNNLLCLRYSHLQYDSPSSPRAFWLLLRKKRLVPSAILQKIIVLNALESLREPEWTDCWQWTGCVSDTLFPQHTFKHSARQESYKDKVVHLFGSPKIDPIIFLAYLADLLPLAGSNPYPPPYYRTCGHDLCVSPFHLELSKELSKESLS